MNSSQFQKLSDNLYIKRNDLLPAAFGGNKYRIAQEYLLDLSAKGCNCLIGYGSKTSNLNRVLAVLCYQANIPCYIVMPFAFDKDESDTFNYKLCKIAKAKIIRCLKNNVAQTVEDVINQCKAKGLNPYYINGDKYGRGNESVPVKAYFKEYKEIADYTKGKSKFDYIFLATGTGMTQSGLIAGKLEYGGKEKIVGISVARDKENEEKQINRFLQKFFNTDSDYSHEIEVDSNYICDGYGRYSEEIVDQINYMWSKYGIPLDPIYTGKAFYGMMDYINKHKLQNKKVLFIHTGGAPNFFDWLNSNKK